MPLPLPPQPDKASQPRDDRPSPIHWEVGAAGAVAHPDYTPGKVPGVVLSGDVAFLPRFGLTSRTHLAFGNGIREFMIGAGPEYNLRYKRVKTYVAGTIGYGHFSSGSNNYIGNGTNSMVISYIGGVDVRMTRHLSVRVADVEYSSWVNFLPNGLTPMVYSSGFTYRR